MKQKFSLGRIVATPGALEVMNKAGDNPALFLSHHVTGDWGEVPKEDKAENELSLKKGYRILSVYRLSDKTKIWIITEADRSATTILLPSEY
jgi:hypothetical protein